MKQILLILLFIWGTQYVYAQKKNIDSTAYAKWPSIEGGKISNDGEYVSYILNNVPLNSYTLVLKSTKTNWEMAIPGVREAQFSSDSGMAVFFKPNDSLCIVALGGTSVIQIPEVTSFQLPLKSGKYLVYQRSGSKKDLVLYNLKSGSAISYSFVSRFLLSDDGNNLLIQTDSTEHNAPVQSLNWINVKDKSITTIWSGTGFFQMVLDDKGSQLVFMIDDMKGKASSRSCFYYRKGEKPKLLIDNKSAGLGSDMGLSSLSGFGKSGSHLFFTTAIMSKREKHEPLSNRVPLNIWSYLDKKLQSAQLKEDQAQRYFTYVINILDHRVTRMEEDGDVIMNERNSDIALILHLKDGADMTEAFWNETAKLGSYVKSVKDGKIIDADKYGGISEPMSPHGRYIVFFHKGNYYSYDMASGAYRSITRGMSPLWLNYYGADQSDNTRGVAAWLKNEEAVLIYDRYDIWMLDPKGVKKPINVTNGHGVKHNVVFYLGLTDYIKDGISANDPLILNAVSLSTKENGFFKKLINQAGDPEKLTFGNYIYDLISNPYVRYNYPVLKARDAKKYLVSRMSATESRNYFYTTDFKKFTPLSKVAPEKAYNWYTTELHTWKSLGGKMLQGVLYKPEDFDPSKKYPVIFNYYEKKSFNLNACLTPNYLGGSGDINIPSYVSNGYLVFTPDIEFVPGDPMQGTYDAIVSAAQYLSQLPFVNNKKMGIQGFSFGSIQTNYLVTHTDLFAAACSASGLSDFISGYLSITDGGYSLQGAFEGGQLRMGGTLWKNRDAYIKNSSVLNADKVTTPLLMMHTTKDHSALFSQAIEFFTGLRRLGKKVWLLEYTEGVHAVESKSVGDFSVRMAQFFDHYLKNKPAPLWMLDGVAAKDRDIKTGLELDTTGRTPGRGLLTAVEQRKVDSLSTEKPVTLNLK